ncbi:Uncharacterised protein [BD1-7 clade bacterium]|uniref:Uncharacterized protein n=1 Tax=BD1-7 clade bacterium TaxID=2029982 RepID=A0A5S9P7L3_9GAMM|nr:Uncharacterised protein [BD1-7 clade bacterium]CAA0099455.1 Uncharacterised protein [BD1-7 clade bacterium]
MKTLHTLALITAAGISGSFLTGCIGDQVSLPSSDRFNIASYQVVDTPQTDITGVWMVVTHGSRVETIEGTEANIDIQSRELVAIQSDGAGGFELRSCIEPQFFRSMTPDSSSFTLTLNSSSATFTQVDINNMTGTASKQTDSTTYSATLAMKKVADLGASFGSFDFYNDGSDNTTLDASCFHEDRLAGNATKIIINLTSELSISNISHWGVDDFHRVISIKKVGGNIDALDVVRFYNGSFSADPTVSTFASDEFGVSIDRLESTSGRLSTQVDITGATAFDALFDLSL